MKLPDYLKQQNLTQAEFGELIGTTQQSVARLCHGTVPRRDLLRKIVEVTGSAVGWEDFDPLKHGEAGADQTSEAA